MSTYQNSSQLWVLPSQTEVEELAKDVLAAMTKVWQEYQTTALGHKMAERAEPDGYMIGVRLLLANGSDFSLMKCLGGVSSQLLQTTSAHFKDTLSHPHKNHEAIKVCHGSLGYYDGVSRQTAEYVVAVAGPDGKHDDLALTLKKVGNNYLFYGKVLSMNT